MRLHIVIKGGIIGTGNNLRAGTQPPRFGKVGQGHPYHRRHSGGYRNPGALDPWLAALLAALLTTWVTFVPCFLWVLLGAPYVERLRSNDHLSAALTGITAAVVGVIANLGVFFALHTLFDQQRRVVAGPVGVDVPVPASADPVAFAITAVALLAMLGRGWGPLRTLGLCAALGLAAYGVTAPA